MNKEAHSAECALFAVSLPLEGGGPSQTVEGVTLHMQILCINKLVIPQENFYMRF